MLKQHQLLQLGIKIGCFYILCSSVVNATDDQLTQTQETATIPLAYVFTQHDGIAYLPLRDLLEIIPFLEGKSSHGLHLRRRGKTIPIAFVDSDGILNEVDTLFFASTHPEGDTTYFNAYSSLAAFEVWYDDLIEPKRYLLDSLPVGVLPLRQHLVIQRHIEQEHEYVQGWLDNNRYTQINSTFVTETVPGERWVWMVTYPLRPFSTLLRLTPDPNGRDSVEITLVLSSISDDVYTHPDNRLHLWYGGTIRDTALYDGPRDTILRFTLYPSRDGCLVDSLTFRNLANTTAAQAIDYITTTGRELAVADSDYLSGTCTTEQVERLIVYNFSSPTVIMLDSSALRWSRRNGERGIMYRIAVRALPQRISICLGDTAIILGRYPLVVAWLDEQKQLQYYADNSPSAVAAFIGALPMETPYAVTITDGRYVDGQLRTRLTSEGSTRIATVANGDSYIAVGIRGNPASLKEQVGNGRAVLAQWVPTAQGNTYAVSFPLRDGHHSIIAVGMQSIERARVAPCTGAQLFADTNSAEYVVVTHSRFRPAAERLARYRSLRDSVRARVVDVQEIFDAFGRGEKSPHALKAFFRYALTHWQNPKIRAVVLMGDASWDPRRVTANASNEDFIPSYGKPVSDTWYALFEEDNLIPHFSVGRLPVQTLEQAHAVVNKIIEHDTMPMQQWQKHFLFITGGADANEQRDFYESVIYSLVPLVAETNQRALCADTTVISLYAGTPGNQPIPAAITGAINNGVGWVNYIGHGAPRTLEVAGWEPERLSNKGRYPVLASFSCQIGAFAEPSLQALGEEFLIRPNSGAVAVIATTGFGIRSYDDILNAGLFAVVARTPLRRVGEVLNAAKQYLSDGSQVAINTIMQTSLLGDPLTRIPIDTVAHPVLDDASILFRPIPAAPIITADLDSIRIEGVVFNAGVYEDTAIEVRVVRSYLDRRDTNVVLLHELCLPEGFSLSFPIRDMPGEHILHFEIVPLGRTGRRFPVLEKPLYVYAEQLYPVEPLHGWDIAAGNSIIRFLNPFSVQSPFTYQAFLVSAAGDTVMATDNSPVVEYRTHCEWRIPQTLQKGMEYTAFIRGYNTANQRWTPWLVVPVVVQDTVMPQTVTLWQGKAAGWSRSTTYGLSLDTTGGLIFRSQIAVELMSAGGYQYLDSDTVRVAIQPGYRLRLGGVNVASERNDEVGVHLAVVSSRDGSLKTVRWYATWTTTPVARSWGSIRELIGYLRDTVEQEDYVLLVSCGAAWGLQYAQYAQEFARVLSGFGATKVHLLTGTRSYLFVGMRSNRRPFVVEHIGSETPPALGDTLWAKFGLPLYLRDAELTLPVAGPAARWHAMHLDFQDGVPRVRVSVYGGQTPETTTTLLLSREETTLLLDSILAAEYPYLRLVCSFSRDSGDFNPYMLRRAAIQYTPKPEFAAVLDVLPDKPLRGDTVFIKGRVVNLVQRSGMSSTQVVWQLRSEDGTSVAVPTLPDTATMVLGDTTIALLVPTLSLPQRSLLQLSLPGQGDLYGFNNTVIAPFFVREDTQPPTIRAYANGRELGDTSSVPQRVTIECGLIDSAAVPISDRNTITLRLNGVRLPAGSVRYVFYSTDSAALQPRWRATPLIRAAVETEVELERGTNVLLVNARDAFGNTTTAQYVLVVHGGLSLDSAFVIPNPAGESEQIELRITYRGFAYQSSAVFELYDALGRRVRSQTLDLRFGDNIVTLPLLDQTEGGTLKSGVYYWRVWLTDSTPEDARSGLLTIVR
ncbi:MAG: C25 family cysteine peptidase [Bacteroidota bacterium]|nr:C25 family cysteine peptidase [Candidatus Kapabacteria bacterium]MDW8074654.1 C25 family cysteine peptidase [Bacteroidota bacterium]